MVSQSLRSRCSLKKLQPQENMGELAVHFGSISLGKSESPEEFWKVV
jgi:hypothetical protein